MTTTCPPLILTIGLLDLPVDILLRILACLESRWILTVRQCCKPLCEMTRDRGLWIEIFRKTAKTYKVLPSSYQPESMTQKELEKTALNPHRFVSLLLNFTGDQLRPSRSWECLTVPTNFIDDPIANSVARLWRFTDVQMAFGGRFLFSVYGSRVAILWGFGTDPDQPPSPIASLSPSALGLDLDEKIITKEYKATPDGRSFYLELIITDLEFGTSQGRRTQMCKVNPFAAPESVLVPLASREHHGRYDTVLRDRDLLILEETSITLWDFEADRSISWETGPHPDQTMFCLDGYCSLLHYTQAAYTIWQIPLMTDGLEGHIQIINEPKCRGDVLEELRAHPDTQLDIIEPKGYTAAPMLLTFVPDHTLDLEPEPSQAILDTYAVSIEENPLIELGEGSAVKLRLTAYSGIEAPRGSRLFHTFYGGEDAAIVSLFKSRMRSGSSSTPGIYLHVRAHDDDQSGEDDSPPVKNTVGLMPPPSLSITFFDICPFSGRCTVAAGGWLHVYEYI